MKSIFARLCTAGALLLAFAGFAVTPAWADDAASPESHVIVLRPLSIIKDKDLDFGLIVPGTSLGYVVLAPEGTVTSSGGIVALAGQTQPATFYGYGTYRQYLRLSVSTNNVQLRRNGGPQTMRLDQLLISSNPPTTLTTTPRLFYIGSLDGFFSFALGGRLRVGANQRPGEYVGTFDVNIEYL